MGSRMDKYRNEEVIPTRSDKNKKLYTQIYNAYDNFENLVVPSNAREISPSELKKEITSRQDYRRKKEYDEIANNRETNNTIIRKEKMFEEQKKEEEVYDINELLNKATADKKGPELIEPTLANQDYLKRLKLDNRKTNIEQVKEMYEEIKEDESLEDESLMKTANLSLEILSDLKGDSDKTIVSAPIKNEELPDDSKDNDFYSNTYKFSKKDFENKDYDKDDDEEEDEFDDEEDGGGKFFLKILMIVFGIALIGLMLYFVFRYFNKV